jgi:hypothetical protein
MEMNTSYLKSTVGAMAMALLLMGCESNDTIVLSEVDVSPPATPRGVYSITGDLQVTIVWLGSDEQDLAGYRVYRAKALEGPYDVIAEIRVNDLPLQLEFTDRENIRNGKTYYYAVTSFDFEGNESELSYEDVFDTPRPAGVERLYAREVRSSESAFDFSSFRSVASYDSRADIVVTLDGGTFFVEAVDHPEAATDIQDFGYTETLDALDWAVQDGWSTVGWTELILGHTYLVWTWDNHFAKFRVTSIGSTSIVMDWAYQIAPGNPELKPAVPPQDEAAPRAETR